MDKWGVWAKCSSFYVPSHAATRRLSCLEKGVRNNNNNQRVTGELDAEGGLVALKLENIVYTSPVGDVSADVTVVDGKFIKSRI